ncbi:AAA family ATPase [Wohlfahrtiimonas chitiniclastica]|uniref:AAA family ATPase n=1 Tax=Wohlfahrtiimonas chitiniclastica TaxID=400946 RepID=UPI001FEF1C37|nr:AAA family ATPase [Wohlfahrtiimonas chitiniclastica]
MSEIQNRITNLINHITADMYEREEIIAVALLGALSGQNTFLLGPPGTAKSLISRRLASAFVNPTYFEYLMNRFSTPDEVFGPVSIKALKEDTYTRKTEQYLPTAEFAFLDEIWKSSPAILNTLLTLINEHIFKNGDAIEESPMKALIAASNEIPQENQGLDALYDRFIIRMLVEPIQATNNFDKLLNSKPSSPKPQIPEELLITKDEWETWRTYFHQIELSKETLDVVHIIRNELAEQSDDLEIYVSDRRWQRAALLMKASAFFNDRTETNHSDIALLKHCIWTTEDNKDDVINIIEQAIIDVGFDTDINLAELDREKELLDKEIHKELFYSKDIWKTKLINQKQYFEINCNFEHSRNSSYSKSITIYIPFIDMKSTDRLQPCDLSGNTISQISYKFDGQGSCTIKYDDNYGYGSSYRDFTFIPKPEFYKGDRKSDINIRLIKSLKDALDEMKQKLITTKHVLEQKREHYQEQLISPFITQNDINLALNAILKQSEQIDLRIADCERLEALCQ